LFHNIILSFTLISFSLVAKLHFDGEQKDGMGSGRTLKLEIVTKATMARFHFSLSDIVGFPFRRKLRGVAFEPCLLSHTPAVSQVILFSISVCPI
jgi:hypothetical protein